MAHNFEIGGYLREPEHYGRRGRIQRVVGLTRSGLPRIQPREGDPYTIRGCSPATEADWLEQERQDATEHRIRALDRRLRAPLGGVDMRDQSDQRAALIDAAAADWLRASGWTVTAPGTPPHEGVRVLAVMRDLHGDGALADVYDIRPDCEADLDEAVTRWAAAGYPGAGEAR